MKIVNVFKDIFVMLLSWSHAVSSFRMGILKFHKRNEPSKEGKIQSVLLTLDGPLALLMPSSAIEPVN